ncbi:MAG TPA: glycosyltransferase family A protein [Polyangiaceae bacterium]|jgi:glycosyltransferase involved in cell wall biosynthesis|nr:glycosyltransferase family A protein [Polyangiaceae bacterium]
MARIAIVIPTRNRGAQAAEAANAVLADPVDMDLVVVDQSIDDSTVNALGPIRDPRLRVVRSELRGASNARNVGVAATTAPIIAFTDDDCRPAPGWASTMASTLEDHPEADLVFGRVHLPPKENDDDYAASFEPIARIQEGDVPLPDGDIGIGANFAIRRTILEKLGGFDPLLGPGAPFFRGAEETDLLIRALNGGHRIINARESDVLHLGIRTGADVRPLHVQYQFAVGAAFGKHARLSGLGGLRDVGRWVNFYVKKTLADTAQRKRPRPGVLFYFVAGAVLTYRYRVDRTENVFRPWLGRAP